ncbi:MAG: hypothetical protein DHS20C06_17210 [Hyphobacterium sp.]|nr:MAG: hypothetical protein DHS20C06_17210 [Hyphobacterium sp.]
MRYAIQLQSLFCVSLSLFVFVGTAFGQSQEPSAQSDESLWQELQSLSGTQVEDSLWDATETATERVFGHALERDTGETVLQALEAATDRDWRSAFETAGPAALSAYLPGIGQYIETIQGAANQINRATDRWAVQLYDHDSYRWIVAQVDAREADMNRPMMDDYGDPYFGRINDHDEAFMPSYALPDGSAAKQRARQFEADLFERFQSQPFYAELIATDYTDNGGGASGLYENSYAAMARELLGYQPEPRRLFNHFYHRYTRDRLDRYFEVHEYVQAEHMRRAARRTRQDLIDAYRAALETDLPTPERMLNAFLDNDAETVSQALDAGFDANVMMDLDNRTLPFMYWAGLGLMENEGLHPLFETIVAAGGNVQPSVPDGTPEIVPTAISAGDEDAVLRLLDAGFRNHASYREGDSVLLRAVAANMPRVVTRLVQIGHDPNTRNADGNTVLLLAVNEGQSSVISALVDGGADPSLVGAAGGNALHLAALNGQARNVALFLQAGANANQRMSGGNRTHTPLALAAMRGHMEAVRTLVEAGADPAMETSGSTPSEFARANGHTAIADYLENLDDASELDALTPAEIAHRYGNEVAQAARELDGARIRQILDELGPERERMPLNYCARGEFPFCDERIGGFAAMHIAHVGDVGTLARLNETGIGLEYESANGNSSTLIAAVVAGRSEVVNFLLNEAGLDPNVVTANGRSAIAAAVARNDSRMVTDLLNAGADPALGTMGNGVSALHHAAIHGNIQIINDLRDAGAQAMPDGEGRMPGYYSYWLHQDENLAIELGYGDARGYAERERRRNQPGFDWAEFAREMQPALAATVQELQAAQAQNYQNWQDDDENSIIGESTATRHDRGIIDMPEVAVGPRQSSCARSDIWDIRIVEEVGGQRWQSLRSWPALAATYPCQEEFGPMNIPVTLPGINQTLYVDDEVIAYIDDILEYLHSDTGTAKGICLSNGMNNDNERRRCGINSTGPE